MRLLLICISNNSRYLTLSITDASKFQSLEMKVIKNNITLQFTILYEDYLKYLYLFKDLEITSDTSIPHYDIFIENITIKLFDLHADIDLKLGDLLKNSSIRYNRECRLNDLFKDDIRDDKINYLLL